MHERLIWDSFCTQPHTLIAIWNFVRCVWRLLSLCSLIMRATTTLRGVAGSLCVSQHRSSCLWIDLLRSKNEWFIYPSLLKSWSKLSLIKYPKLETRTFALADYQFSWSDITTVVSFQALEYLVKDKFDQNFIRDGRIFDQGMSIHKQPFLSLDWMIQSPVSEGLETVSLLPGRRHANCVPNKFGRYLAK